MSGTQPRKAMGAGLRFVAAGLGASGQWPSRRHRREDRADEGQREVSPCVTGAGLLALAGVDHPLADEVRRRSRAHLAATVQPPGLWRYYGDLPCDVDTSSIVALALGEPGRPDPASLLAGRISDGRFRTWLVGREPLAEEIDAVVNANAAAALAGAPGTEDAVRWVAGVAARGFPPEASWYYRDELDLALAVQRAADAGVSSLAPGARTLAARAAARIERDAEELPAHRLAQAVIAAAWRRPPAGDAALARAGALLAGLQRPDGSWPAGLLWVGPYPPRPPTSWFSADMVTTALCVHALWAISATGAVLERRRNLG